jgi:hypothetical protein
VRTPLVVVSVVSLLAAPATLAVPPDAGAAAPPKAAQGPAPSTQGRQLSRALVSQKTWNSLLDRSAEGLSSAVSRSLTAKGEKVPADLQATIRTELGKSMRYEEAVDAQATALQKRFSPAELEQAAKFYDSALGKKMLTELPAAQGEVGDQLQERLTSVVPEIIHRVAPGAMGGSGSPATPGKPGAPPTGTGGGTGELGPDAGAKGSSGSKGL